jgi:hypothetical protein
MKTFLLAFSIPLALNLMFSSLSDPKDAKTQVTSRKSVESAKVVKPQEETNIFHFYWLNPDNGTQYQETSWPFFNKPAGKPGC